MNTFPVHVATIRRDCGLPLLPPLSLLALALSCLPQEVAAQAERKQINFAHVEALAAKAAKSPHKPVDGESALPANLRELSYDRYRHIRFRPEKEFWKPDGLPFGMALFHPG